MKANRILFLSTMLVILAACSEKMDSTSEISEITGLTAFVINASKFLSKNGLYILLGVVVVAVTIFIVYKNVVSFRSIVQSMLMRMPVIGNIIIYNAITIFTKTFASLLKNNVFITV